MSENITRDNYYMQRCLDLARNGSGNTSPNPMVGSVIVYNDQIIGEGYHIKFGEPHAEVNSINSVINKDLLNRASLYVNLEPCSHYGKTPPCADLIIQHKIPKVIIGSLDPNPLVSGSGMDKLIQAGCEVTAGVLKEECEWFNRRFNEYHKNKKPYIVLKWAQSADGYLDKERNNSSSGPEWITNDLCRILVHKWRSEEQTIMVGTNTAILDNPTLNVREWHGTNPVRIVIDQHQRLPGSLKVFNGNQPTIVYTAATAIQNHINTEYKKIDFSQSIHEQILEDLYNKKIISIIVEGGATLLQSFINKGLWNEARIFKGVKLFGDGVKAPAIYGKVISHNILDGIALDVIIKE